MTPAANRVLQALAQDPNHDLVRVGDNVNCGFLQTTVSVVDELLRISAIKVSYEEADRATYYVINDIGRAILRRPSLEGDIAAAVAAHRIAL